MFLLPRFSFWVIVLLLCSHAATATPAFPGQHGSDARMLSSQLDSADAALDAGNEKAAIRILRSSIRQLNGLISRERTLTTELSTRQKEIYALRDTLTQLEGRMDMKTYQLDVSEGWRRREKVKNLQAQELQQKTSQLSRERLEREALIRYVLIASVGITLLIGFLIFRRMLDRRRAVELKAEIAEARAATLEAEKRRDEYEARKRFTRQLIDSQEQERKRIAADLHDGLGQDLLVIKNRITLARREIDRGGNYDYELDEITTAVASSLQDIRRISRNLRPFQLDRLGLTSTLESMLKTVRDSTGLNLFFEIANIDGIFSKAREMDLYRILQESVNNVVKHAEATELEVTITRQPDLIVCRVRDNGKGFQLEDAGGQGGDGVGGFGLQGMRERAVYLDGNIQVTTALEEGCTLSLTIPIPEPQQSASNKESVHAATE
ncbi:hypothetical protein KQI65_02275 [bacterium]|nr:hypothetical protein [bacterium]